jgi:DNA-binding transcriptional LysR family regulator
MPVSRLIKHLKFRELAYLVTLGRIRSIHGAATLHGMSQPALSKALKELELTLGQKLFQRSRRGVVPTLAGEIVIAQAAQMITSLDLLATRLDAERQGHGRVYRIGAAPNPASRLIPTAYVIARRSFANLVVELVEGSTDDLLVALKRGEYSLVVGRSSPQNALFNQVPLYPEVGVIVARANHPAAGRHHASLKRLLKFPWVLPHPGPTRAAIELGFMRGGCSPPSPSFINYGTQIVCEVLAQTDALSVLPFWAATSRTASGLISIVPVKADFQLPTYAMYTPQRTMADPALACLEAAILEVAALTKEVSSSPGQLADLASAND